MSRTITTKFAKILALGIFFSFLMGGIVTHAGAKDQTCDPSEYVYKVITVEEGDTLWSIAKEWQPSTAEDFREYIKDVEELNHLRGDLIREGQNLVIYCGPSMADKTR